MIGKLTIRWSRNSLRVQGEQVARVGLILQESGKAMVDARQPEQGHRPELAGIADHCRGFEIGHGLHRARFEAAAAHEAARRGLDGVIGHIHHPAMRDLHGVLYCNDGDWVESCTVLVEHPDGALEILRWTHQQTAVVAMREPRRLPETPPVPGWAAGF